AMLDTLAESDAVQRTLLAGLPHDLKGPLSRMWLRIEMLDDPQFKDGMRNDLQDMQRMVDQFIGFVRGTDSRSYQFDHLPLNGWLSEYLGAWASTGSDVRYIDTGAPQVVLHADRMALGRLLDNLITNALNHGKAPVSVGLRVDGDA